MERMGRGGGLFRVIAKPSQKEAAEKDAAG